MPSSALKVVLVAPVSKEHLNLFRQLAVNNSAGKDRARVESRCDAVVIGSAYLLPALSVAGASLASP
jgi:hypothetical protein